MMRVFEDNQKRRGACCGCELLEQVPFEEWNVDQVKITNIVWNHFILEDAIRVVSIAGTVINLRNTMRR
jgi:hypothetical protein